MRVGVVILSFAVACTARPLDVPADGGPDLSRGRDLAMVDLAGADLAGDMAMPPPNPCPAGARFIFTIDQNGTLSRFSPASAQFFDVGPIACPASDPMDTPNSMAIDRTGDGYVNYQEGEMFRLLTATAECMATPYVPGQFGITSVGMSFAEDAPGSSDETLWITPTNGVQASLSSIDLMSFEPSMPITLKTSASDGELTGDDQANLWGFFPSALAPFIARIDKAHGTLDRQLFLPALSGNPQAWGFAAWQDGFYVFLERDVDASTVVYHVDGASGDVQIIADASGRTIVGVGVATCAGEPADGGAPTGP